MLKLKIFVILLLISILVFWYYSKTLNFQLNFFLVKNNIDVGIATIKDDNLFVVNNKKYPLLSLFKYFVAIKVLKYVDRQEISLNTKITINKSMVDMKTYSPMIKDYQNYPFDITIAKLLEYMISQSDNNACDILIDYSGGINELECFIHDLGFEDIKIKVNEKEMNTNIHSQYFNVAYPKDVILLMKKVKDNKILSGSSFAFLEDIMFKTKTGENKIKSGLPYNATFYHKTGSGSRTSRGIKIADNDAGYVILPNGDLYYIVIMIKDSSHSDNENARIMGDISKIVYQYFFDNKN